MFGRKFKQDDYEDRKRYEEYQKRQREEAMVKGLGSFFLNFIIKYLVFIVSMMFVALALMKLTDFHELVIVIISFICAILILKIKYVKVHPFKSLITMCFLIFLELLVLKG